MGVLVSQNDKTEMLEATFEPFGNYVFLKKLAAGGMAEIFLARPASHMANGRVQVVKRILPHVANNPMFVRMFQTEIQVIMGFNHPHVVQLHDFGEFNGQPYISMEYIEGKNLKEIIQKFTKRNQMVPIPTALSLISQAAAGLNYAHTFVNKVTGEEVHAIHRDISPHNLLVSYEGNLKVIDFGIAKAASGVQEATRVGTLKGKLAYMAPEQVSGQPLDGRCDVFALGIVAWELLTLRRPFSQNAESELTILSRIEKFDEFLVPPSNFNSEVPAEVDEILLKALRKNPEERFQTARDFQVALRQVMLKYYPSYTYAETGQMMHKLFEEEIENERKELQSLNLQAQTSLSTLSLSGVHLPQHGQGGLGMFKGIKSMVPGADNVDVRLQNIEKLMKQKASSRHYMMLAFYILSLVVLKMEGKYNVFNMIFPDSAQVEVLEQSALRANPRSLKAQRRAYEKGPGKNKRGVSSATSSSQAGKK